MRLIHCADLHLDSNMTTHLSKEKAKERKAELLRTFSDMVEYAGEHEVDAILIAGDLFDRKNISATARGVVRNAIVNNPNIVFYYLQGNHDVRFFMEGEEDIPANLRRFDSEWTSYVHEEAGERLVITGLELTSENAAHVASSLTLNLDDFNIVILHGQEAEHASRDKTEVIPLRSLRGKGIDYLALGHVHRYKWESLDGRGVYCYPGCLEGRGFDECGEHGFVLLDIDVAAKKLQSKFVPIAGRTLYELEVDVSTCMSTGEIVGRVKDVLVKTQCCDAGSLIKIVLTGEVEVDCEKDLDYLVNWLKDDYYYVCARDKTTIRVDYDAYALDESLKGEFVRKVRAAEELSEEDKGTIIRYGIKALAGEELEV